jgi:hypothetical protein
VKRGTREGGSTGEGSRQDPHAGRGLDPAQGALAGEAADQGIPDDRAGSEGSPPFEVWSGPEGSPGPLTDGGARGDRDTHYGLPVLKEPVWIWPVPAYFVAGGAAGAALVLGAAAQFADRRGLADLVRWSRRVGIAGCTVGTALLVADLGRPSRFLNMLRVFRPTSPLNVGSWVLAGASSAAGIAALLADADGSVGALGDAAGLAAGLAGLPLAGYTAVLLSNSAVPLWSAVRRSLPALFVSSAASSAGALLTFAPLSARAERVVRAFTVSGLLADAVATRVVQRSADAEPRVGEPLRTGMAGTLWRTAEVSSLAALALSIVPGRWGRRFRRLGAAGSLLASVAMRFAIFHGGKASARDPLATFEPQRRSAAARIRPRSRTSS